MYKTKMLMANIDDNNYLGICCNKHGNVVYKFSERWSYKLKNVHIDAQDFYNFYQNKSIRPIVLLFCDGTYCYFVKVQDSKNESINYGLPIKTNQFGIGFPYKNSKIIIDTIYRARIPIFKEILGIEKDEDLLGPNMCVSQNFSSEQSYLLLTYIYKSLKKNIIHFTLIEMPDNLWNYSIEKTYVNDKFVIPYAKTKNFTHKIYINLSDVVFASSYSLQKENAAYDLDSPINLVATHNDNKNNLWDRFVNDKAYYKKALLKMKKFTNNIKNFLDKLLVENSNIPEYSKINLKSIEKAEWKLENVTFNQN